MDMDQLIALNLTLPETKGHQEGALYDQLVKMIIHTSDNMVTLQKHFRFQKKLEIRASYLIGRIVRPKVDHPTDYFNMSL